MKIKLQLNKRNLIYNIIFALFAGPIWAFMDLNLIFLIVMAIIFSRMYPAYDVIPEEK